MPEEIKFTGSGFEVIDGITGNFVAKGYTPIDIAMIMKDKLAKKFPHYSQTDLANYYNVVLESAQVAMQTTNTFVPIYDRKNAPPPTTPPNRSATSALPSGWVRIHENIWQKSTPGYLLDVQFYNSKYYETVTDLSGLIGKRYIDNTPYTTLIDAIKAANDSAIRHSSATTKEKMKTAMEQAYGSPVGIAGTQNPQDNSIIAFKEMLHYMPYTSNGEMGQIAKLGQNVYFFVASRGQRYHTDVIINGQRKALGNYNLKSWAMYEAPYFWYEKNRGLVNFGQNQPSQSGVTAGHGEYIKGSGKLF